jgi:hypothetical protein
MPSWHSALAWRRPKKKLTHIAVSTNTEKGPAVWLQQVTDEEYHNYK